VPVHLDQRTNDVLGPIPRPPPLLLSLFHTLPSVPVVQRLPGIDHQWAAEREVEQGEKERRRRSF
jgi:hypothetical protein